MDQFNNPIQGFDGWGVNASYLTPAYMANFRPKYGNDSGRPNPYSESMSMRQSAWRMGPGDHPFGNDVLQDSGYDRYNIASGVSDAAVWGLQNVAIPAAAWTAASSLNRMGTMFGSGRSFGERAGRQMGGSAARAVTGTLGRGMGMLGMGRLAGAGAGAASTIAGGAGWAGAAAGGMFLPLLAAQGVAGIVDSMFADSYVSTRRGMDSMMANTANTSVFGSGASATGGFGMSATRAQKISQSLTEAGGQDLMLDRGDYNEIADNMMRAGIFQEVGDMDTNRIVDGVKKASSVLKLIQRITGDTDIKNGIQTLATLKSGGLDDIQKMGEAVNRLRNASAVSGVSMSQLMDTIGNQGAVMAQQQGISANTGMLASADAFAGFTNARRAGLISGTESAMLGGAEGMTQNLMGGAYQTLNSGISRMIMQGGGKFGNRMGSNIQAWGSGVSGDPLASQGDWFLNQQVYKDKAMNEVGASGIILKSLQGQARSMGLNPRDPQMLASVAPMLGISSEQLRSAGLADRSAQNPMSRLRSAQSRNQSDTANRVTELQNNFQSMYQVPVIGSVQKTINEVGQLGSRIGDAVMNPVTGAMASISDSWASTILGARGIDTLATKSSLVGDGFTTRRMSFVGREKSSNQRIRGMQSSDKFNEIFGKINALMDDPTLGSAARDLQVAIHRGDNEGVDRLIRELDSSGLLSGDASGGFSHEAFSQTFSQDVSRGAISVKSGGILQLGPDRPTLRGRLSMMESLTDSGRKDAITKLIKEGRGREIASNYGLSESALKGLTPEQRKDAILKAATTGSIEYGEIDGDSDEANEREFFSRFQSMGLSRSDIDAYAASKGGVKSLVESDLQQFLPTGWLGDGMKTQQTKDIAKDIAAFGEAKRKSDANRGTDIDWSSMKDVTSGMVGLGQATQGNTRAIEANTEAQVAVLNQNKRGDRTYTTDEFYKSTENTVKKVDSKYVGSIQRR